MMERKERYRYKIRRMTGGIREGVNMEKDGDSEEDNDEEVVKQVVKRRFEGRG
jgi:hypothetical protein